MNKSHLVHGFPSLAATTGIPIRTLKTLWSRRKFSGLRVGHRTMLFDPQKVLTELGKFEIRAAQ